MKSKALKIVTLVLAMIMTLTACGSAAGPAPAAPAAETPAAEAPAAEKPQDVVYEKPEYEWKFGDSMSETHPLCMSAQAFADKLFEITKGRCHVTVYPNSTLGSLPEMAEQCDLGLLEFFDSSMANFSTYTSKFYTFNMP